MHFIFMLTVNDRTIPGALDILDTIAPLNLRHIGFKDIGADLETLAAINKKIQATGAQSYLEVVATTPESALNSARMAVEIGVDHLLGGTQAEAILGIIKNTGIKYYPFPGTPEGHPTRLAGSPEKIAADSKNFIELGCAGIDLLAYRATQAEPAALIAAARAALGPASPLICAGDINTPARIAEAGKAGASHFTIGSAALNLNFAPAATLNGQLEAILACT
jgi:hypothetical protein